MIDRAIITTLEQLADGHWKIEESPVFAQHLRQAAQVLDAPDTPAVLVLRKALQDGVIDPQEAAELATILWPELGNDAGRVAAVVGAVREVVAGLEDDGQLSAGETLEIVTDLLRGVGGPVLRGVGGPVRLEDVGRWAWSLVRGLLQRRPKWGDRPKHQ